MCVFVYGISRTPCEDVRMFAMSTPSDVSAGRSAHDNFGQCVCLRISGVGEWYIDIDRQFKHPHFDRRIRLSGFVCWVEVVVSDCNDESGTQRERDGLAMDTLFGTISLP